MDLGLAGRRATLLAGTRGLGCAAAHALAREGCEVVVCGRRDRLPEANRPPGIHALRCDVGDAASLDRFLTEAVDLLGGVDVLVTNCGGPRPATTAELTDEDWSDAYDAMLLSVVRSSRRIVPLMVAQGRGSIVCIASVSAVRPLPGLALSNALRSAVLGFAQTLAVEVAAAGVRVNCILPGPFATERSLGIAGWESAGRGVDAATVLRERAHAVPAGRLGDPDELGRTVAFLASDASAFWTGTAVVLDGGFSLGAPDGGA